MQDDDNLISPKHTDGFTTESPIRAFTEFKVAGTVAIGKGFRPSLAHLHTYLDAMERKEGWRFVQILLPETDAGDPTVLFHQVPPMVLNVPGLKAAEGRAEDLYAKVVAALGSDAIDPTAIRRPRMVPELGVAYGLADDHGAPHDVPLLVLVRSNFDRQHEVSAIYQDGRWFIITRMDGDQIDTEPMNGGPLAWREKAGDEWTYTHITLGTIDVLANRINVPRYTGPKSIVTPIDDPVNPKHYRGTRCAEIGELLSANSYQVLKYNWRLGEKDDPCVEIGKSLWYLDREVTLGNGMVGGYVLPVQSWFDERLEGENEYVRAVAVMLIDWNRFGRIDVLRKLRVHVTTKKAAIECGSGLAI